MENKKVVLLLSGGIDSTTLLAQLSKEGFEITALSLDYGQKHRYELELAKQNAEAYQVKNHKIISIAPELFSASALVNKEKQLTSYTEGMLPEIQVNAYVPFRNLLFLSMALSLAESLDCAAVYAAFNKDDGINYWDCGPTFLANMTLIAQQNSDIQIESPFLNLTKKEVLVLAKKLDVNIKNTISCYQPIEDIECGICFSCTSKINAMQ